MEVDCELLSPQEAARRLSLGKTRLYELLGSGAIPSVRVGKLRRIPTRALRAYVDGLLESQSQLGATDRDTAAENRAAGRAP